MQKSPLHSLPDQKECHSEMERQRNEESLGVSWNLIGIAVLQYCFSRMRDCLLCHSFDPMMLGKDDYQDSGGDEGYRMKLILSTIGEADKDDYQDSGRDEGSRMEPFIQW